MESRTTASLNYDYTGILILCFKFTYSKNHDPLTIIHTDEDAPQCMRKQEADEDAPHCMRKQEADESEPRRHDDMDKDSKAMTSGDHGGSH